MRIWWRNCSMESPLQQKPSRAKRLIFTEPCTKTLQDQTPYITLTTPWIKSGTSNNRMGHEVSTPSVHGNTVRTLWKKGISWHISYLITKKSDLKRTASISSDHFNLNIYIHLFENGTQCWFCYAHIIRHLLLTLSMQFQNLKEICMKTDNAGYYHSTPLISFISQNTSQLPIRF